MKVILRILTVLSFVGYIGVAQDAIVGNDSNPFLADPTIFLSNGTYYLYGTTGNSEYGKDQGFLVYTSNDLKDWKGPIGAQNGLALKKGDAFGDTGFWAPQVFEYQNIFYMAYTANEHIAIATSDSPLGSFKYATKTDLEAPVRQIDPFVFFDSDGKKYLYHIRLTEGNRIFVAELEDDSQVAPRRSAIVKIDFKKNGNQPDLLKIEKESFRFLKH